MHAIIAAKARITRCRVRIGVFEPLEAAGLVVKDIAVLVDRRPAGGQDTALEKYTLHAAFTLRELAERLGESGLMTDEEQAAIQEYLSA